MQKLLVVYMGKSEADKEDQVLNVEVSENATWYAIPKVGDSSQKVINLTTSVGWNLFTVGLPVSGLQTRVMYFQHD